MNLEHRLQRLEEFAEWEPEPSDHVKIYLPHNRRGPLPVPKPDDRIVIYEPQRKSHEHRIEN